MILTIDELPGESRHRARPELGKDKIDFEAPLTSLVWITSLLSIVVTFAASKFILGHLTDGLW